MRPKFDNNCWFSFEACEAAMMADRINRALDAGKRVTGKVKEDENDPEWAVLDEARPNGSKVEGLINDTVKGVKWIQIFGLEIGKKH